MKISLLPEMETGLKLKTRRDAPDSKHPLKLLDLTERGKGGCPIGPLIGFTVRRHKSASVQVRVFSTLTVENRKIISRGDNWTSHSAAIVTDSRG
jgi:hypothetical protein